MPVLISLPLKFWTFIPSSPSCGCRRDRITTWWLHVASQISTCLMLQWCFEFSAVRKYIIDSKGETKHVKSYRHLPTTKIKPCTHLRFDFNLLHQQHLSGTLLTSGWNLPDLPPVDAVLVPSRHVTCVSQGLRFISQQLGSEKTCGMTRIKSSCTFDWEANGSQGSNLSKSIYMCFFFDTPPKTNMEPENAHLEKEKHLQTIKCWVRN